ncbi:hypothetical protein CesoFtcFv8_010952 [Champsocephalus esox]|uniref:Uncharacterized protein n=1 Tax=Champsocephalus esox TaxID=159716 RepID=A0AAN8C1M4_9TELE|nr:hypothetical protein CesoFtcFv8_010952 [Champsocephalus esox]
MFRDLSKPCRSLAEPIWNLYPCTCKSTETMSTTVAVTYFGSDKDFSQETTGDSVWSPDRHPSKMFTPDILNTWPWPVARVTQLALLPPHRAH